MTKQARSSEQKQKPTKENQEVVNVEDIEDDDYKYSDSAFRELEPSELHNGYEASVEDWLLRNNLIKKSVVARVYKFDGIRNTSRVHCGKFVDEVPDEDEIGRTFGAGKYSVILNANDSGGQRRISEYKFTCAEVYDEIKNNPMGYNPAMGYNPMMGMMGMGSADRSFDKSMDAMAKMLAMIMPLVRQQNTQPQNVTDMISDTYKMMTGIMKRSVLDQTQLINDMGRRNAGLDGVVENIEESTGMAGILAQLKPYVDSLVPLFVGQPNLIQKSQAAATVQAIKKHPEYPQFVRNRKMVSQLCKFIEDKHGKKAVAAVLKNFQISKPRRRIKTPK